jgi:hypothetical protein
MVTCRVCHNHISLSDVANSDSWHGEESVTCIACAAAAVIEQRAQDRLHRLTARDPGTHARIARTQAMSGFNPDGLAVVETWALCERCLAYLKDHRVVRFKADGRMLRWLETDHGHPAAGKARCDACHVRRAAKHAVLRIARPTARSTA